MIRSIRMVSLAAAVALAFGCFGTVQAANSQQAKMTSCNAEAKTKGLKGAERKSFMKSCLSADTAGTTGNSQQEKMKSCNADAKTKGLKGAERKAFMKDCLKAG